MRQRSVICHTSSFDFSTTYKNNNDNIATISGSDDHNDRSSTPSQVNPLPFYSHYISLHSILKKLVLKSSFLHSATRVTSLILVTVLFITLTHGTDAKPYASKRLSFGEVRTVLFIFLKSVASYSCYSYDVLFFYILSAMQ